MPKDGTQRKMFSVVLVGDSDWDDKIAKLEVRLFDRFSRAKKVADQFVGQLGVDRVEIYAGPCEYEDRMWAGVDANPSLEWEWPEEETNV